MKNTVLPLMMFICCCGCVNDKNQNIGAINHPFMIYGDKQELSNAISIASLEPIPLNWFSMPPDDHVRLGIHQDDTLLKISTLENSEVVLFLGKLQLPLDSLKILPKFTRYPHIALEIYPPPVLYSLDSFFVFEGRLPRGWEYGYPESFYILTPK